ncbi:putative UPF0676 protein [Glarea lozoyensis 74030]|uniref:Putative UPF0676 protein n=1 Tax=Glarea lozoyensis (strain ATCC 74030 / MF5533) TaxID=1104152 RepID=H0EY26_GLAL7|nr:putative UPF0676 protein [Glarea lozoyensis 74030]
MAPTKYTTRTIPKISLHDFPNRIEEITHSLITAAQTDGFFTLTNHTISTPEIESQFALSESFFSLPSDTKSLVPFSHSNTGWEANAQVRPSTGFADRKESYQMQFGSAMEGSWLPESVLPGFKVQSLEFMRKCQSVSEKLMLCFARGLGFEDDYFIKAHDISRPESQTVLRLLHYFPVDPSVPVPDTYYRAGAHVDWDFLTLLFQRPHQSGLEICPGREASTAFAMGDTWTKVEPAEGEIGPGKKYPAVTGREFTKRAMERNFRALDEKKRGLAEVRVEEVVVPEGVAV